MNYGDILSWLQGVIGNQQGINNTQFGQSLGQQGQEFNAKLANNLAMPGAEAAGQIAVQAPQLALQGREFDTSTALQRQQQMWQQQMADAQMQYDQIMQGQAAVRAAGASVPQRTSGPGTGTITPYYDYLHQMFVNPEAEGVAINLPISYPPQQRK